MSILILSWSHFPFGVTFLSLQIFKEREEDLRRLSRPLACTCFRTSIWDETLYKVLNLTVHIFIYLLSQLIKLRLFFFVGKFSWTLLGFFSLQAWSSIVYQLIPNVQQLETNLRNFAQIIEADEVLLFERATFLVRVSVSSAASGQEIQI